MKSTVFSNGNFYDKWESLEKTNSSNKPSHNLNAYYNAVFGKLNVDFNADFYWSKQSSNSLVMETSQNFENRTVTSDNDIDSRLMALKLIFSYPILGGQLSLGSEYTDTHRKDKYQNKETIVPSSTTHIQEQNNSFFTEYSHSIPIGKIGAGLRYENVTSDYFNNNKRVDEQSRRYNQWFPNILLATQIKNMKLQLSYTVKTQRPSYRQLSNNVLYGNRLTLQSGNPFLKSSIIHDITMVNACKFLQLTVSYKEEHNAVIYWTAQMKTDPKISIVRYRNLKNLSNITIFVSASPTFGFWSPQANAGMVKQWVTITSNNDEITLNKPMFIASFNNSFSLPKGFLVTLDINFQGKGDVQNIYLTENQYIVNIGLTKSFLNNRLDISLKGHDLFKERKEGNLLYNKQMELYQLNRYNSRKFELTIRYKFNIQRKKCRRIRNGQIEIN